jgi:membrane associated rhomboid family serine protease
VRRPPPLTRFFAYPATAGVGLLAAAVTGLSAAGRSTALLTMEVRAFERQPWRLFTSALPHKDPLHLVFNLFWLWVFGTALEERFGPLRLLGIMLLLAAGSAAAEYAIFVGGVGLSGVTYGLFGLLWVLSRTDKKLEGTVDRNVIGTMVAWFLLCIAMTVENLWPVANVAHGVGALLGALLGLAIAGPSVRRIPAARAIGVAGFVALLGASLAGASVLRPRVNLARYGGRDSAYLAFQALEEGRLEEAIARYQKALATSPGMHESWYNLGVARTRTGDDEGAAEAFARAVKLAPEDENYRVALRSKKIELGAKAIGAGRNEEAVRLCEEALQLGDDDYRAFWYLAVAYGRLGRKDDVERILGRARARFPEAAISDVPPLAPTESDAGAAP